MAAERHRKPDQRSSASIGKGGGSPPGSESTGTTCFRSSGKSTEHRSGYRAERERQRKCLQQSSILRRADVSDN
jgi:hypothetical protein